MTKLVTATSLAAAALAAGCVTTAPTKPTAEPQPIRPVSVPATTPASAASAPVATQAKPREKASVDWSDADCADKMKKTGGILNWGRAALAAATGINKECLKLEVTPAQKKVEPTVYIGKIYSPNCGVMASGTGSVVGDAASVGGRVADGVTGNVGNAALGGVARAAGGVVGTSGATALRRGAASTTGQTRQAPANNQTGMVSEAVAACKADQKDIIDGIKAVIETWKADNKTKETPKAVVTTIFNMERYTDLQAYAASISGTKPATTAPTRNVVPK